MFRLIKWFFSQLDKCIDEAGMQGSAIAHNAMTRFSEVSPQLLAKISNLCKTMPIEAAIILVHDKQRNLYLAVHRKNDKHDWGFPGGKIEPEETPIQGAIRELEEETPYTAVQRNVKYYDSRPDGQTNVHVFVIDHKDIALHTGGCEQNYGWVTKEELIREESSFGVFNSNLFADMQIKSFLDKHVVH